MITKNEMHSKVAEELRAEMAKLEAEVDACIQEQFKVDMTIDPKRSVGVNVTSYSRKAVSLISIEYKKAGWKVDTSEPNPDIYFLNLS